LATRIKTAWNTLLLMILGKVFAVVKLLVAFLQTSG
jgi:hypothetical protein